MLPRAAVSVLMGICCAGALSAQSAEGLAWFETRVRPWLLERCTACHGTEKRKGGLRLDTAEGLRQGGSRGPIAAPGDPSGSLVLRALRHEDPELRMPPKGRLPDEEIAIVERWIALGAPLPDTAGARAAAGFDLERRKREHWCWQPVADPPPPDVRNGDWVRDPLDRFVLAGLERAGLPPAAEAGRRTWLRRAAFALTGLPPDPAEIAAFERDMGEEAFARAAGRLLASPHFGERFGRHWLDLVRYAETRGHEFDYPIANAWQYRDWVIRALNADLPFDRFVVEQVAGDLVEPPRRHPAEGFDESVLGTGFWLLGEEVHSPVDIRQDELDRLDNRLDTFGKAFLGMTVACARCHDHKFDAISQRDYYGLAGFLLSSSSRQARFDTIEAERAAAGALDAARARHGPAVVAALAEELRKRAAARPAGPAGDSASAPETADRLPPSPPPGGAPSPEALAALPSVRVLHDFGASGDAGAWFQDGFAFGTRPLRPGEAILGPDPERPVLGFATRAAAVADPLWPTPALAPGTERDPAKIPWLQAGRVLRTRTFGLGGGRVHHLVRGAGHAYACVASHRMLEGPLHGALVKSFDTGGGWAWVSQDLSAYAGLRAHIEWSPAEGDGGRSKPLEIAALIEAEAPPPLLPAAPEACPDAATALERLASAGAGVDAAAALAADGLVRASAPLSAGDAGRTFAASCAAILARLPRASRTAPALFDGAGVDECVLARGSAKTPLGPAPRRFLEAIDGPAAMTIPRGSGRLALAERLVDPANPLVARVAVNRVWHHLFGRGLVPGCDDFGAFGERPSHQELLDHLARRFVAGGWSLKRLVRAIVLSSAYRQSSREEPAAREADPRNDLFHHHALRRLEAEAVRDALLAVSGRLDRRMGGPPVPVHLTPPMEGRGRPSVSGPLDGDGRRTLYVAVRRNFLDPFLLAFDFPAPFGCVGRRTVSNVPAQALALQNHPLVRASAERTADRILAPAGKDDAARVTELWLRCFARPPEPAEAGDALDFLAAQCLHHGGGDDAVRAAWTDLAHVLFNATEFTYVE